MSDTPDWVLEKIREAKEKQLKKLILRGGWRWGLTEIPTEVFELNQLEVLDLSHNQLTSLPDSLDELQNLKRLDLSSNRLTNLPTSIGHLQSLIGLDLSDNQLIGLPDSIGHLQSLIELNLSNNRLAGLPNSIGHLQSLIELNLSNNQLIDLPDSLGYLQSLIGLDLSNNRLANLPATLATLQNLKSFDLSGNRFTVIPDVIYELPSLERLFLRGGLNPVLKFRNRVKEISPKILEMNSLRKLDLKDNPVEIPPLEVTAKGLNAIKNYFRQLEAMGQDYLYEAKLLIIGEGGAGKTTLARKIESQDYVLQEDEKSTEGIEVIQWEFPLAGENLPGLQERGGLDKKFRVNIWDFGGQEIYHATHQFFLTKRSLYALVADTRKEDTDFYYWLNVVELLSDNSPLLIIKNEKQDRQREINERQLRGQFSNLEKTLATNLATNRNLPEVILPEIKHYLTSLPHIGAALPKTWVKVREALENDSRNHISLDEYLAICQEHGFTTRQDKLQLSDYLHDLGVCLHFRDDPLLKKTIILKPEWGTAAVYKVLDNKTIINNRGRFSRTDLDRIWHEEQYTGMQDELLQLMMKFKLCYAIPSNPDTYIAPQLLTENQPDYPWPGANNLRLRYSYEFMPKGILTQFIVATHPMIATQKFVWKSGIILKKDEAAAEVIENYGKREITIRVTGKNKKDLLTIVTHELDKIHASYRRLKYDKLIPCNCPTCKTSHEPHFYPFEILRRFVNDRQLHIQCQKSYQMVEVLRLMDDVIEQKQAIKREAELEPNEINYV